MSIPRYPAWRFLHPDIDAPEAAAGLTLSPLERNSGIRRRNDTMAQETIGFIGLGLMGHGIAKNIVEKGYALTITGHRNRKPIEDLVGRGAVEVSTAKDVAAKSSIVFICVTGSREGYAACLSDAP